MRQPDTPDENRFLKRILFITYALPLRRRRRWECTAPIKASPAQQRAGTASGREPGQARGQSWGLPHCKEGREPPDIRAAKQHKIQ